MNDMNQVRRNSQAELLTTCATSVENAVVGILSMVLNEDGLDTELEDIKRDLLARSHRLRQIAILTGTTERR